MTNSESVKQLIYVRKNLDEYLDEDRINAVNIAISALEENDKLKAEIEQLKEDYSVLARQYDNVENSSIRYYNEVKQLKSELKQSVKFKEYFMELYNQGLEVSNWHLNGNLEPLTNFIDFALEEAEQHLKDKVEE